MAKRDLTSLLGRDSGVSFGDLAGEYLSGKNKKDNRARNVLIASLFFNAKESKMQKNAQKNLEDLEKQKVFEISKVTNNWNAYNTLMQDDEAFKKDKNYFRLKSETEFSRLNPEYDLTTEYNRTKRKLEIDEYQNALEKLHNDKISEGDITKKLSKEEFFKPFEDYYRDKEKNIKSPENISLVHKGFSMLTGRKKDNKTEQEIKNEKLVALQSSYDYLLNPDIIQGPAAIDLYRDPNDVVYNRDETNDYIIKTYGNKIKDDLLTNILEDVQDEKSTKDNYTINDIKSKVITSRVSQDVTLITQEINKEKEQFKVKWEQKNNKKVSGLNEKELKLYNIEQQEAVDLVTGLGDEDTITLNRLIRQEQATKNPQEKNILKNRIRDLSIGKIEQLALSSAFQSMADPEVSAYINNEIRAGNFKDRNEWFTETVSQQLEAYDNYLNLDNK
tara:strand:+ start:3484 stop:4818 length:1335 start_codon:yes stop_codon:yes gene_type:complete